MRPGLTSSAWASSLAALALAAIVGPGPAGAQPSESNHANRPWFEGTTLEQRERAQQLFVEGNRLLEVPDYVAAANRYQAAIEIWDNPGFHYNLAAVQHRLVQPIAAYKSLGRALRHGPAPLSPREYRAAVDLRDRLEKQLVRIEVVCDQPDVKVTLDGEHLVTGERRFHEIVRPGSHQLTATKPGHQPDIHELVLQPGEQTTVRVRLRAESRIEYRRRWPRWIPYAVVGAGSLLLAGAGWLDRDSSTRFDQFDARYGQTCPTGCRGIVSDELQATLAGARRRQHVAVTLYAAGGAILVTGAVLVYMNREIAVEVDGGQRGPPEWTIAPTVSAESISVTAAFRF